MSKEPKEKPGIMLYFSSMFPAMQILNDNQLGTLVRGLVNYGSTGEFADIEDESVKIFYLLYLPTIDRDTEKYEDTRKKNSKRSRDYWAKKKAEEEPTGTHGNPRDTQGTQRNQYKNKSKDKLEGYCECNDKPDILAMKATAARRNKKNQEMEMEDLRQEAIRKLEQENYNG